MRKIFILLIAVLAAVGTSAAADGGITVFWNNEEISFEQEPVMINNSTLVPFRAVFEHLDMTVQWVPSLRCVTAEKEGIAVTLYIDDDVMLVNNEPILLNTAPIIYNDYTLVPLRAVSEAAGASVSWDGEKQAVYIDAAESTFDTWGSEVLELTNNEREKNGLKPLKWDFSLSALALSHCTDMMTRSFVAHDNPDGETPFDRMHNAGIQYRYAGENIAAGIYSPEAVVKSWMESEEHRKNILNPNFEYLGVGVVRGGDYGIYWAQEFVKYKEEKTTAEKHENL